MMNSVKLTLAMVSSVLIGISAFAAGIDHPASDYQFMGCRPSVGECFNSCPSQNGQGFLADPNHPECSADSIEPVACYCPTAHNPDQGGGEPNWLNPQLQ